MTEAEIRRAARIAREQNVTIEVRPGGVIVIVPRAAEDDLDEITLKALKG